MTLSEKVDDVIKTLEVALQELAVLDKKRTEIENYERDVRDVEKLVLDKEHAVTKIKERVTAEQEQIQTKRLEVLEMEKRLERSKSELKVKIGENEKILEDIKTEQERLNLIKKEADGIKPLLEELRYTQNMIAKETELDRKRKEILDIREKKIKQREQQLQMEAEI